MKKLQKYINTKVSKFTNPTAMSVIVWKYFFFRKSLPTSLKMPELKRRINYLVRIILSSFRSSKERTRLKYNVTMTSNYGNIAIDDFIISQLINRLNNSAD